MEGYTAIGKLGKSHGVKGEVKITVEDRYWEDFEEAEVVFVEQRGKPTPYFVESIRGANGQIVKFEDVDSPEDANIYLHMKILYLRKQDILLEQERTYITEEELEYGRVKGYTMQDKQLGLIGEVEEIEGFPQQEMAYVSRGKSNVLIPLIPVFIVEIDDKNKLIKMDLPEGLLTL